MDKPKRILIVEDEPDVADMVKLRMESAGLTTEIASNGKDALEAIKKNIPDLIISDVLMPVMDGFSFYKELKKSKVTADIPVLILTARGKMEDSFMVMGADDFIAKPFDGEQLMKKVQALLGRAKIQTLTETRRVLVAGEESEVIENMTLQLRRIGCVADMVSNGPQVISKVVLFLPQVLLIEVQMEEMPASEVIKILRQMPQGEKIPILTYSYYRVDELGSEDVRQRALSVSSSEQACRESGATEYIGRFNETNFLNLVQKHLQ